MFSRRVCVPIAASAKEMRKSISSAHFDRLQHPHGPDRSVLLLQPHGKKPLDEGHGRAVKDRHLCSVDVDQRIVDRKACQGRHHMFDRRHKDAVCVLDHSAQARGCHRVPARRNQRIAVGHVGPAEHDPMICRSRAHDHPHQRAGMQTTAGKAGWGFQSVLHVALNLMWQGHALPLSGCLLASRAAGEAQLTLCDGM
jgi:hypothetical protein